MSEDPIEIALWILGLAGCSSITVEMAQLLDDALRVFAPRGLA